MVDFHPNLSGDPNFWHVRRVVWFLYFFFLLVLSLVSVVPRFMVMGVMARSKALWQHCNPRGERKDNSISRALVQREVSVHSGSVGG